MIPIRDNQERQSLPIVTITLVILNVLIYLWDRQWNPFGPNVVFADLGMRPYEVVQAIKSLGQVSDHFPLVTVFTSMFLHGSLMHLLGNMIFLYVFGSGVEYAMGPFRYALYYLFWGCFAAGAQIYVDPHSIIPMLGASGAIGGVLGAYFLLFPSNKIELIFPLFAFISVTLSAWVLLGLWFLWQILVPQQNVANWAHAGGFLAGMVTVLVQGGRAKVLQGRDLDFV